MTMPILPARKPRWRTFTRFALALSGAELLRILRSYHLPLLAALAIVWAADLVVRMFVPLAMLAGRVARSPCGTVTTLVIMAVSSGAAVSLAGMYKTPPGSYPWMLSASITSAAVSALAGALFITAVLAPGRRKP